jgi:hypothetical protein
MNEKTVVVKSSLKWAFLLVAGTGIEPVTRGFLIQGNTEFMVE